MDKKLLYWSYFIVGAIANFSIVLLPFFYVAKGMNNAQIGLLLSAAYLAALLQPLMGYLSDSHFGPKKLLKYVFYLLILLCIFLYFSNGFFQLFIFSLLFSICRNLTFPLLDNIALDWCHKNDVFFGGIRQGGSIGFGLGAFLAVPFALVFNSYSIIFLPLILSIIFLFILKNLTHNISKVENFEEVSYLNNFKILIKNKEFIVLVLIHLFLMGISSLKLSYQATLLSNLNAPIYFIVILNFFTIVPEIFLISKTEDKLKNIPIYKLLAIPIILNIIHSFILFKSNSLFIILIASFLHGFSMSIYIPNFFAYFNSVIPKDLSATAFIVNATSQTINSLIINTIFIVPLLAIYNIRISFLVLIFVFSFNIINLFLLARIQNNKKKDLK